MIPTLDLEAACAAFRDRWSPKVGGRVNDQSVEVAKLLGQSVWHRHDVEPVTRLHTGGLETARTRSIAEQLTGCRGRIGADPR